MKLEKGKVYWAWIPANNNKDAQQLVDGLARIVGCEFAGQSNSPIFTQPTFVELCVKKATS